MSSTILKKLAITVMVAMALMIASAAQAAPIRLYEGVFVAGENGLLSWFVNGAGNCVGE